jgi:hypothetical protein
MKLVVFSRCLESEPVVRSCMVMPNRLNPEREVPGQPNGVVYRFSAFEVRRLLWK